MAKVNEYIDIAAYKNTLKCINKDLFTSGNIRVNKLRISLDSWWDNLSKWFCFRVRDNICYADEVENIGSDVIVTIPSSIFTKENIGNTCFFGIYGSEGEEPNIALSTEWYNLGKIEEGVYATNTLIAEADSFLAAVDAKINGAAQLAVNSAELSLNEDYVLTLTAKNEKGEILSSSFVDLPIEELVKDGRYDEENKEIVLILEDGKEVRVPVGDLIENKVDKLKAEQMVYATDNSTPAKTIGIMYATYPADGAIAKRDYIGSVQVPTAQDATQAVNKGQMDTALDGKVDKTTERFIFYGTDSNGQPYYYRQESSKATKFTVPLRNGNGAIVANRAEQDMELVPLIQMNTALQDKLNKISLGRRIYGTDNSGSQTTHTYSMEDSTRYTIPMRNNHGAIVAGNPTQNNELTTKEYVDNAIATAVILVSPNGTKYKISVNDDGSLTTNKIDN